MYVNSYIIGTDYIVHLAKHLYIQYWQYLLNMLLIWSKEKSNIYYPFHNKKSFK